MVVEILVNLGADIYAKDSRGKTAFIHATEKKHESVARKLKELGAAADASGGSENEGS